jgi:hypothetical protein
MAKARTRKQTRGPAAPAVETPAAVAAAAGPLGVAPEALVSLPLRRFPWPADPRQRYNPYTTPYLAVVNARGPWACWRHGAANPPFIPLCLDLFRKGFWRAASDAQRVFALTVWAHAARDDDWGIVWGDPARLMHEWGLDPVRMIDHLDWMIGNGLACYLTHAEAAAARSWRPWSGCRRAEGGETKGGTRGGNLEEGQGQASKQAQGQEQGQAQASQDQEPAASSPQPARAPTGSQLPGSAAPGQNQEQGQASQGQAQPTASTATAEQPQRREAANLPKSDQGAGSGLEPRPAGRREVAASGRPPSVPEAVTLGQILSAKQLAWGNPLAVDFARHIVTAITGRVCEENLDAASDRLLMDLGPWVYFWVQQVQNTLPAGSFTAFRDRCVRDIGRKKRGRGVKNLGGLARADIVPGVLQAMVGSR